MAATIRDVARRAGVSISTVSRVLNDTARVSAPKRALVLEAVEALGYAPNPAARSLLNKSTGGLGVLLPFVSGEFFSEFLHSLDEAAQQADYFLLISTSHRHRHEFKQAVEVMNKRVDGFIIMAPELHPGEAMDLVSVDAPIVFVNTRADTLAYDVLNFDNHGGAYTLTEHLISLGHRRIAFIKGPEDAHDAAQRRSGFHDALSDAGLPVPEALVIPGEYTQEAGYDAAQKLLNADVRPTAVVCANDHCATGAIRALHEAGLAVPDDVSVVGFDALPSTQYNQPPLTSVRVPIGEIGREAVRLLQRRLSSGEHDAPPTQRTFPVDLVLRGSTARPPRDA